MKISEILGIGKTQFELDFVDIDVDGDLPLFIDPIYISKANTPMINKMYSTLSNFFDYLMELINSVAVQLQSDFDDGDIGHPTGKVNEFIKDNFQVDLLNIERENKINFSLQM